MSHQDRSKEFLGLVEAKKYLEDIGIKTLQEYRLLLTQRPELKSILSENAHRTYKNRGWKGYGDYFGTNNVKAGSIEYVSFEEAREFAWKFKLKNQNMWFKLSKTSAKPINIPAAVSRVYKDKGWKGWKDFLGTDKAE